MSWTSQFTAVAGQMMTAALWNTYVRDDFNVVKFSLDDSGNLAPPAATTLTIATGAVTATQNDHKVDTESAAAADDLDTVTVSGSIRAGHRLRLWAANVARVVTVRTAGNIVLRGDNYALDAATKFLDLQLVGSTWYETNRSEAGGELREAFRGVHLRTHPDGDKAASTVELIHADEIVLDDGRRLASWDRLIADITASGENGLDTGSEAASTWYSIYAIAKADGTKGLLLHREPNQLLDQTEGTAATSDGLRSGATTNVKLAQGFQVATAAPIDYIDIKLARTNTPTGRIWLTIESDNAGSPSGTVLATSDKLTVDAMPTTQLPIRMIFRTPFTPSLSTQYHLVLQGDYTASATDQIIWYGNTANTYANGVAKKYSGTVWANASNAVDFNFKLFVRQNDTAVTLPTGYTAKAKVGYVYNDGSNNFIRFVARDRQVQHLYGNRAIGPTSSTTLVAVDLSALIPPGVIAVQLLGGHDTDGALGTFGPVPDGFDTTNANPNGVTSFQGVGTSGGPWFAMPPILTTCQGAYIKTTAGNANFWVAGFQW